jgi:hypothetical protein
MDGSYLFHLSRRISSLFRRSHVSPSINAFFLQARARRRATVVDTRLQGPLQVLSAETAETSSSTKECSNIKRLGGRRRTPFWPPQTAQTAKTPFRRCRLIGISLAEIAEIAEASRVCTPEER